MVAANENNACNLSDVKASDVDRLVTGPWDDAFGGGIVRDSSVFLAGEPGAGKCLHPDTLVLKFDGTRIRASDVVRGDLLMGPDSQPRKVLSTSKGSGPLFEIVPIKGEPWICNSNHIMTVVSSHTGEVFDIPIGRVKSHKTDLKLFRTGVEFPANEALTLPPYFIGVWFGDGTKAVKKDGGLCSVEVTKPDPEIRILLQQIANDWNLNLNVYMNSRKSCPTFHLAAKSRGPNVNRLLIQLRNVVGSAQNLPHNYLVASRSDRLELLAGLLDTDGHMTRSGFEIVQKRKGISDDICFLARSVGLAAYQKRKVVNGESYWRASISGDCSIIPNRLPRKKAPPRKQCKNVLRTGFEVKQARYGVYVGFELDRDGRFLLGDFTVTHNSSLLLQLARAVPNRVLYVAREESAGAIKARAVRFKYTDDSLAHIIIVTHYKGRIAGLLREQKPALTIVDSLQALVGLGPGHLDEAVEVLEDLKEYASETKSPAVIVSQVNKELDFASEMALQHLTDATFMLSVEKKTDRRILRARKNRFGAAGVGVVFRMTDWGLMHEPTPEPDE